MLHILYLKTFTADSADYKGGPLKTIFSQQNKKPYLVFGGF